jgi:DNA polymerase-1
VELRLKTTVINNFLDFCDWLEKNKRPIMAFDTETTSLSYLDMECIGFSLATDKASCYVIADRNFIDYFMKLKGITLVMHNAVFDLKVLHKYGFEPEKIWCTLVGAKLCDENREHYSLKDLAYEWLHIPLEQIKRYDEVCDNPNSPIFYDYAMNDAIWAYQLWEYEKKIIQKEDLIYLAEEIEMPFQFVLRDLEINGIYINKEKLEKFRNECNAILINLESNMLSIFNKKHSIQGELWSERDTYISPINFGSSQQLVACCESLGFQIDEFTDKGNPSVGKTYLQKMRNKHPFFDLLWRYKKLQKLQNSFLEPLEGFIDEDGRVRPSYQMVRTGRLSCSDPNLQQLPNPKKEKLEFNHRELFIPKEGNVLVCADYSGQELRNLAEVSNDSNMVNAFNMDYDLHLFTANRVFNLNLGDSVFINSTEEHKEACKKYKSKRHQAKNGINFPTVYGAFAQRIAEDNNVSIPEAQRWLDEFDKLYPQVKKWKEQVTNRIRKVYYTTTLMGRKRRFPYYQTSGRWEKAKMERQAANFEIQGFSADQMKLAAVKIRQFLADYKAHFVLTVHDELVFEVPEEYAQEFSVKIKYVMEHCICMKVPIIVDVKIVRNYGE